MTKLASWTCVVGLILVGGACGGDDTDRGTRPGATADIGGPATPPPTDSGGDPPDTGSRAATSETGDEAATSDDTSGDATSDGDATATSIRVTEAPDASSDGDAAAAGDVTCDDIFSIDEMDAWFGETVELDADFNESLGHLICTWQTVEDPASTDDAAYQLLTAQLFTGNPIPASNFIDPDIFEEVRTLEGIGDLAFSEESFGRNYHVLDEPVAGTLSYSDVDLGNADSPESHTADELDELFRTFHSRISS